MEEEILKNGCMFKTTILHEMFAPLLTEDKSFYIVFVALSIAMAILTCFGNITVLLAYFKSRTLRRKLSSIFIVNMAVTNLFIGIVVRPLRVAFFVQALNRGSTCGLLTLLVLLIPIFCTVSLFSIVGATFERFVAIVHPFYYRTDLTRRKLRIFLFVSWFYALSWVSIVFLEETYAKVYLALNTVLPIIMTVVITILWVIILFHIHRRSVQGQNASSGHESAGKRRRLERKTVKTFFLATAILYLSYAPILSTVLGNIKNGLFVACSVEVLLLSAVLNPLIYGFTSTAACTR